MYVEHLSLTPYQEDHLNMTRMERLAVAARRRLHGEEGAEEGFTLIELLVVLLIIGILLAIAIPTFLSVTNSANNTAAQANLQTALTGAKSFYTQNNQVYSGVCGTGTGACVATGIPSVDTGLSAVQAGTASTTPHVISFNNSTTGDSIVMVAHAQGTNECWGIYDTTTTGTFAGVAGPATVYFLNKPAAGATVNCKASAYTFTGDNLAGTTTAVSTNGFPAG